MYKVTKRDCPMFGIGPYVCEFICDTASDISTLPTSISEGTGGKSAYDNQKCASGSIAIIVENGSETKQYMLNNQDIWCPYSVAVGSSSGGSGESSITVDFALSETSENPVANKTITAALNEKADTTHTHTANEVGADASGSAASALVEAKAYTDSEIGQAVGTLESALNEKANASDIPDLSPYAKKADVPNIKVNSAVNADTLDGLHADDFVKSVSPRITGDMIFQNDTNQNTLSAIYSANDTLVFRNYTKDRSSICDMMIRNDGVRITNGTQNFKIGDGGNADTVDDLHADVFLKNTAMQNLSTSINDAIIPEVYGVYSATPDFPTGYGDWGFLEIRRHENTCYQTIRFDSGVIINRVKNITSVNWSEWQEIYTSGYKPYVTGTLSEQASGSDVTLGFTIFDFTPSKVICQCGNGNAFFANVIPNGFSLTIPAGTTTIHYIAFK